MNTKIFMYKNSIYLQEWHLQTKLPKPKAYMCLELVFSYQVLITRRLSTGTVRKEVSLKHAKELGMVLKR